MQALDLSPVGLFLEAGLVGKAVMAAPFVASLWRRVLIVEGVVSVWRVRGALRAARADGEIAKALAGVVAAGEAEAHRRIPGETVSEVRARIADAGPVRPFRPAPRRLGPCLDELQLCPPLTPRVSERLSAAPAAASRNGTATAASAASPGTVIRA